MSDINIVLEQRDDIHVAVEEKDINVEVPAGKDGRALRPRGEWSASAAYAYLDLVSYQGSSYVATKAVPAGTLPTDTSYWMLSAEKGEPGGSVWGLIAGDLSDQTDLQTALDAKADVIISSASGSIASFSDGSPAPVTALSVGIEPVQSGTGDPSPTNVRPISGHTSATVTRTGKNLLPIAEISDSYNGVQITTNSDGSISAVGTPTSNIYVALYGGFYNKRIPVPKWLEVGKQYYISSGITGSDQYKHIEVDFYDEAGNGTVFYDSSFTVLDTYKYIGIFIRIRTGAGAINGIFYPQIELSSSATAYEPYQAQQVTIDLNGTRYGGTFDVTTGMLTVDRGKITVDELSWAKTTDESYGTYFRTTVTNKLKGLSNFLCDSFLVLRRAAWNDIVTAISGNSNTGQIYIRDNRQDYATVADFKSANANVEIVYPLATPLTVQLTPAQLSTLLGTNNIWADTGDVAVEYRADTKLFIQGQIAQTAKVTRQMIADSATADGKAPKSLATGDLIIVGDELRKATTNIGNGSAITASNSTIATLADVIKALQ